MKKLLYTLFVSLFFLLSCEKEENSSSKIIDFPAAYVVNADNSISVIRLSSLEVDTTFMIPSAGNSFAHHIYKSPDNKQLVVALPSVDLSNGHDQLHSLQASGGIAILDAATGRLVARTTTAAVNHNAVFSPDGSEIWTALMSHDLPKVLVYNAADLRLVAEIQVGTDASEVIFSSDGKTAYVAAQESSFVYAMDVQTKQVVKQIKVDFFPTNVWPGIDRVFVENKNRPSINIINTQTNVTFDAIDLDFKPGFTVFHSPSATLWICDAAKARINLFQSSQDAWQKIGHYNAGEDTHAIAFSEKLNLAFVVNQRANTVSVIDINSGKVMKNISVGIKPNGIVLID